MLEKLFNRILPYLIPVFIFVSVEQAFNLPHQVYWLLGPVLAAVALSIWQLTGRKLRNVKFWRFVITPFLFTVSGLLYLSFLEDPLAKQLFLMLFVVLHWAVLEVIYLRFNFRPKYQVHSLENIFTHLDILAMFLISSGLFSLIIFLGFDSPTSYTIFAAVCLLLSYQMIWTSDAIIATAWQYAAAVTVATTELFIAVSFLPTSIYVNGLIITVGYYVSSGLARNWLLGHREQKVIRRYLVVAAVATIIVLATAKWQ